MKRLLFILFYLFIFGVNLKVYALDALIVGAMDCEIDYIAQALENKKNYKINGLDIYKGKIAKNDVVVASVGVGKIKSALGVQFLIDEYKPDYVINIGISGALSKNLNQKDLIIALGAMQYDYDISAFGYLKGYVSGEKNKNIPSIYYCNNELGKIIENKIKEKYKYVNISKGIIATGDKFVASLNEKNKINSQFSAIACDMESAAVIKAADFNNIPCVVLRVICDSLSDDAKKYETNEKDIAQFSAKILYDVLSDIDLKRLKLDKKD